MSPPILLERTTKNSSHQWKAVYRCACGELFERQINRDGNYEPGNCRWITRAENGRRAAILQWEKAHVR